MCKQKKSNASCRISRKTITRGNGQALQCGTASLGGWKLGQAKPSVVTMKRLEDDIGKPEDEKERDQRIAGMQRAATMAQHMHPETMAGMLVGQLLGDAIGRWMNGGGGMQDGKGGSSGTNGGSSILTGIEQSAESTAPIVGGTYGDLEYSPELARADYMMTGRTGSFGFGGTPSKELEREIIRKGIENTLSNRAPFDNRVAANDTLKSLGLLGNGFSTGDYSLTKKLDDERFRGWR